MNIGYTGTRHGMTEPQRHTLEKLMEHHAQVAQAALDYYSGASVAAHRGHHGGCVGGDEQFHHLCKKLGWQVEAHPGPEIPANPFYADADFIYPPLPHMQRNKSLAALDWLYAAPYEKEPQPRGGTWKTIGFRCRAKRPLTIVYPDGSFVTEFTP